ncbi:MAG: hypothetical protein IJM08_09085, partial [Firmicutes bacterium]|nr:hypothetical protein [Bacillota bacterium]
MKKYLSVVLILALLLSMAACGGKDEPVEPAPGPGENETTQSAVDIKPEVPDDPPEPPAPPEPPVPEGPAGTNPLSG